MEIVPGLHRLRTPMANEALPWVMPYAFLGSSGVTLFDSGFGTDEATAALEEQLADLGVTPSDIRGLIVSHAHPDHLGMAGWIKEQSPAAEIMLLNHEAAWLSTMRDRWDDFFGRTSAWMAQHGASPGAGDRPDVPEFMSHVSPEVQEAVASRDDDGEGGARVSSVPGTAERNHARHGGRARHEHRRWMMPDLTPDRVLEDGDVLEFDGWRLLAVATPGHTRGHLCMFEEHHRLMFTGDHVLSRITPNVSLSDDDEETDRNPLAEFLRSLERVAKFDSRLGLPAHEDVIEDLPARCAEIIAHHDRRLDEVLEGVGRGQSSATEVSTRVTWNRPYESFNMFKQRAALGETLAHLRLLQSRGRVRRVDGDVVRWERL